MNIHEYQAKQLLEKYGVAVPPGSTTASSDGAATAFKQLGAPLAVVKAQVHAGGRGKGIAIGLRDDPAEAFEVATGRKPRPDVAVRGVQLVRSAEEARSAANSLLGKKLVTYQTGPAGQAIGKVLVTEGFDIEHEFYLGIALDRHKKCPVVMASTEGGVDIEKVAHETPERIYREPIDVGLELQDFQAAKICQALGFQGNTAKQAKKLLKGLVRFYLEKDVSLVEINPLIRTKEGDLYALDAKVVFDDNALFRHADVAAMRDEDEEDPQELRAGKSGLSYVQLDGNIACLVNGAGLAMATMDIIKYHGGEPANFLDVGGGATKDQVLEGFRILLSSKKTKAVLVNIFGGIMRCDTIAKAILAAYEEIDFKLPLVVRLEGTNVEEGRQLLEKSGRKIINAVGLTDAAQKVVAAAKGQG